MRKNKMFHGPSTKMIWKKVDFLEVDVGDTEFVYTWLLFSHHNSIHVKLLAYCSLVSE